MQIQTIELKGFWSYRDQQRITISGLPLLVGVGENGAGKSAILVDAIIVAFYGRFPTETIDESITTGADQGEVSVEFLLGDTAYRVGRVYPRVGEPSGVVAIADPAEKTGWRTIAGPKVTSVNDRITALTGMDYQTATMTWIAEQAQYGKFSSAEPTKKFRLLSGIFGLDEYTPKARAAHELWKSADAAVATLDGRIAELLNTIDGAAADDDVSGFGTLTDDQVQSRALTAEQEIDRVSLLIAEVNAGDPKRQTVEARQALELVRNARMNTLTTAESTHTRASRELTEAHERAHTARTSAETRHATETSAAAARTTAARENADRTRHAALEALSAIAVAQRELPDLVDVVTGCREAAGDARAAAATASSDVTVARAAHAVSKAEWATLKTDVANAEARIEVLRRSTTDTAHASCFSCGQHLSADDALALIASQERDISEFAVRQAAVKAAGAAATAAIGEAEARRDAATIAATDHDASVLRAAADVSRAEALIATRTEREDAADDTDIAVTRAVNEETAITRSAAAERESALERAQGDETAAVAEATVQIEASAAVIAELSAPSEKELSLVRDLEAAEALIGDSVVAVDERRAALDTERHGHRRSAQSLTAEIARRAEGRALRTEQAKRLTAVQAERETADHSRLVYATLSKAFGPTGIPAMILASVVDSLNDDVNESLTRLSHGELTVQIRASRESASGKSDNKVTVYVVTPAGTRSYKGLSGGQKFRVDLAIRVGLAKAVARGTGTPIKTFILDEGWGALDEKGIASSIDMLFQLGAETNVITVSHIDAVREAFPAKVLASMTGKFSTATVVV